MPDYKPGKPEKNEFKNRPIGDYEFVISKAEARTSEAGNRMLALELTDTDNHSKFPRYHWISQGSEFFTNNLRQLIEACGQDPEEDVGDNSLEAIADFVQGKYLFAHTKYTEKEGKKYEAISYFISNVRKEDPREDLIHQRAKKEDAKLIVIIVVKLVFMVRILLSVSRTFRCPVAVFLSHCHLSANLLTDQANCPRFSNNSLPFMNTIFSLKVANKIRSIQALGLSNLYSSHSGLLTIFL